MIFVSSFGGWKMRTSFVAPPALLGSTASATEKASKIRQNARCACNTKNEKRRCNYVVVTIIISLGVLLVLWGWAAEEHIAI